MPLVHHQGCAMGLHRSGLRARRRRIKLQMPFLVIPSSEEGREPAEPRPERIVGQWPTWTRATTLRACIRAIRDARQSCANALEDYATRVVRS